MPSWSDIFNYTGHAVGQPSSTLQANASESGQANYGEWTYQQGGLSEGGHDPGKWSYNMPSMFQDIISPRISENVGANEGNSGTTEMNWDINYSKLPRQGMTALGRVDQVAMAADPSRMLNPKLIVNDPVYGRITPAWNFKTDTTSGAALMGRIVPALAMGFLGGQMGSGLFSSLGRGAVGGARLAGGMGGAGAASVANPTQAAGYQTSKNSPIMQLLRMLLSKRG